MHPTDTRERAPDVLPSSWELQSTNLCFVQIGASSRCNKLDYKREMISHIQEKVEARRSSGATEEIDNEKYLRRSMARPKLLVELTGDDQIFVRLHMWAREVLRDVQMKD